MKKVEAKGNYSFFCKLFAFFVKRTTVNALPYGELYSF